MNFPFTDHTITSYHDQLRQRPIISAGLKLRREMLSNFRRSKGKQTTLCSALKCTTVKKRHPSEYETPMLQDGADGNYSLSESCWLTASSVRVSCGQSCSWARLTAGSAWVRSRRGNEVNTCNLNECLDTMSEYLMFGGSEALGGKVLQEGGERIRTEESSLQGWPARGSEPSHS